MYTLTCCRKTKLNPTSIRNSILSADLNNAKLPYDCNKNFIIQLGSNVAQNRLINDNYPMNNLNCTNGRAKRVYQVAPANLPFAVGSFFITLWAVLDKTLLATSWPQQFIHRSSGECEYFRAVNFKRKLLACAKQENHANLVAWEIPLKQPRQVSCSTQTTRNCSVLFIQHPTVSQISKSQRYLFDNQPLNLCIRKGKRPSDK